MRIAFLFLAMLFSSLSLTAQDQPNYASIKLEVKEDYNNEANSFALKAAYHILSTPLDANNQSRLLASQFLLRWMSGSPHYSFEIGEQAAKIYKGNDDLLIVYLAAMAKFSLENPDFKANQQKIKVEAIKQVLAYCQAQKIGLNKELKKLQKANEAGELEKYIK